MATLQTVVDTYIPDIQKARYSNQWIGWLNLLLKELASRSMMPLLKKEVGILPYLKRWLDKPSDYRGLIEIVAPANNNMRFRVEEVNNRLRLMDVEVEADEDAVSCGALTGITSSVTGCTPLLTGRTEDDLVDYLFVQKSSAGLVLSASIIGANADSGSTTTALTYMHPKTAALVFGATNTGELISPEYYLLMKYWAAYTAITAMSDEIPIENELEEAIVVAWLRWKVEERLSEISQETMYWRQQAMGAIARAGAEINRAPKNQAKGRRLVGLEKRTTTVKGHPSYSVFSS